MNKTIKMTERELEIVFDALQLRLDTLNTQRPIPRVVSKIAEVEQLIVRTIPAEDAAAKLDRVTGALRSRYVFLCRIFDHYANESGGEGAVIKNNAYVDLMQVQV